MKRSDKTTPQTPEQWIAEAPAPSPQQMEFRINRVWEKVQAAIDDQAVEAPALPKRSRAPRFRRVLAAAALIVLSTGLAVVSSRVSQKRISPGSTPATGVASPRNAKSSVSPGHENGVSHVSMEEIEARRTFRSENRSGTTLALPDESRVEMRSQTELSFERAADGLRILLKNGSILVSAAKQGNGHLYVRTKDVTVSVVGTVFLVKAEPEGSRVAVIEGEVHVQKGATTERLFPGEQVATNSAMAARPMIDDISWSDRAEEHFSILQQSALPPAAVSGEPKDTFDAASIRPVAKSAEAGERGGGQPVRPPACLSANAFAIDLQIQLDPDRFAIRLVPLYTLIGLAYGNECPAAGTLTGGPDWVRAEDYDLTATIPAGIPRYTKEQLLSGNAPQLQRMLQNLLADRFKLALKRGVEEMQGYNLVVAQPGKLKSSGDQTPDQTPAQIAGRALGPRPGLPKNPIIPSLAAPISRLTRMLQRIMGRPIVDETGLTGLYDIWLEFPEVPLTLTPDGGPRPDLQETNQRVRDLLPAKLEAATGLKLEPAKVPAQVLVIVGAEKPSPN
jgi:uncharacterized protein (TIGR03435 family)